MSEMTNTICQTIDNEKGLLLEAITARRCTNLTDLSAQHEEPVRGEWLHDASDQLSHLAEAVAASSPPLFAEYIAWEGIMLGARGIPATDVLKNLAIMHQVVRERLSPESVVVIDEYFEIALKRLLSVGPIVASPLEGAGPYMSLAKKFLTLLLNGERRLANRLVLEAVDSGVTVKEVYLHIFEATQRELGRLWQLNQISIAQEHYCTAATQLIMAQLYPRIFRTDKNGRKLIATSVAGELHEIGVRIIADFFEMEGWDTYYLGANTPTSAVIQIIRDRRADLLAVSATMTSHIRAVQRLIMQVRQNSETVKILVGGNPFNIDPTLWQRIGADAYAADASAAIALASRL